MPAGTVRIYICIGPMGPQSPGAHGVSQHWPGPVLPQHPNTSPILFLNWFTLFLKWLINIFVFSDTNHGTSSLLFEFSAPWQRTFATLGIYIYIYIYIFFYIFLYFHNVLHIFLFFTLFSLSISICMYIYIYICNNIDWFFIDFCLFLLSLDLFFF